MMLITRLLMQFQEGNRFNLLSGWKRRYNLFLSWILNLLLWLSYLCLSPPRGKAPTIKDHMKRWSMIICYESLESQFPEKHLCSPVLLKWFELVDINFKEKSYNVLFQQLQFMFDWRIAHLALKIVQLQLTVEMLNKGKGIFHRILQLPMIRKRGKTKNCYEISSNSFNTKRKIFNQFNKNLYFKWSRIQSYDLDSAHDNKHIPTVQFHVWIIVIHNQN